MTTWDLQAHAALVQLAERVLTDPSADEALVRRATSYLASPPTSPRALVAGLPVNVRAELRAVLRAHFGKPDGYCGTPRPSPT